MLGLRLAACAAAACLVAGSAQATVLLGTFTGTVSSGVDATGAFGTAGGDLTGQAFTVNFTFDTDTAGAQFLTNYVPDDDGLTWEIILTNGPGAPLGLTTFTIGGNSVQLPGYDATYLQTYNTPTGRTLDFGAVAQGVSLFINSLPSPSLPFGIATPYDGPVCDGGCFDPRLVFGGQAPIYLDVERYVLAVQQPGVVPEPGTWAIMIAGFGLAGSVLRRRRAALA